MFKSKASKLDEKYSRRDGTKINKLTEIEHSRKEKKFQFIKEKVERKKITYDV